MELNEIQKRYQKQIEEIVEVCRRDGELGYGPSAGGNVSCRVEDNLVLITPTHTPKRMMRFEYICAVDMDGNPVFVPEGKKPTGEMDMHLRILKMRPDVKAIMHAHPPLLIGMSMVDMSCMALPISPEVIMEIGPVIKVPYADPNTERLAEAFDPFVRDSNGFVMENHGALACSTSDVLETVERVQMMENLASSILTAKLNGKELRILTKKEVEDLDSVLVSCHGRLPGAVGRYRKLTDAYPTLFQSEG